MRARRVELNEPMAIPDDNTRPNESWVQLASVRDEKEESPEAHQRAGPYVALIPLSLNLTRVVFQIAAEKKTASMEKRKERAVRIQVMTEWSREAIVQMSEKRARVLNAAAAMRHDE
jgi:hypothetical protein